ncbi:hypothetical protein AB0J90_03665 [Micromonospora sp. NPDC049523]|uniref:hypothetical protein n=1 Tax=Micromonospora sp. NPDC049523 TaxID=3155921 RepID=UPI0034127237
MTTTLRSRPVRTDDRPEPTTADRWAATVALARGEAKRGLRHPATVAAVLLLVGPWLYGWLAGTANRYPVLQDTDRSLQFVTVLLFGGAALIVGNLAVLRPRRHRTTALYDVLVLPVAWRTAAHLLTTLAFGLLAAVLVAVLVTVAAVLPGAAGRLDPYELLTTPVAVVLLGAVGVLLARLVGSVLVAVLAVLGSGVLMMAPDLIPLSDDSRLAWFLPVTSQDAPVPLPVDLLARPAGPHLVYLTGLVALVAVAALARAGARGRRTVTAGLLGFALLVGGGVVQARPVDDAVVAARITATDNPAAQQTCRRIDRVSYCAFPDFAPWVDAWDEVLRGVLRRVPAAEAEQPLAVRQRVWAHGYPEAGGVTTQEERQARADAWRRGDVAAGTPSTISVGTRWGRGQEEAEFAGLVAYEVMSRRGAGADGMVCGARGVLVGWLAGQATPETAAGLRMADENSWGGIQFGEPSFHQGVSVTDREMVVVWELLRRPADEVAVVVRRNWAELTAPDTSTERVGELFGVTVPPQVPEDERGVCTA